MEIYGVTPPQGYLSVFLDVPQFLWNGHIMVIWLAWLCVLHLFTDKILRENVNQDAKILQILELPFKHLHMTTTEDAWKIVHRAHLVTIQQVSVTLHLICVHLVGVMTIIIVVLVYAQVLLHGTHSVIVPLTCVQSFAVREFMLIVIQEVENVFPHVQGLMIVLAMSLGHMIHLEIIKLIDVKQIVWHQVILLIGRHTDANQGVQEMVLYNNLRMPIMPIKDVLLLLHVLYRLISCMVIIERGYVILSVFLILAQFNGQTTWLEPAFLSAITLVAQLPIPMTLGFMVISRQVYRFVW